MAGGDKGLERLPQTEREDIMVPRGTQPMSTQTAYAHIVRTPGICGGRPRIDGHRVRVQDIAIEHDRQGLSPEEICQQHPSLSLAEVHSALAYYYDHREAILAEIVADQSAVEEFRQRHPESSR